ncbi:MAG: ABC transporter permease [Oscillospiraceae bacterium]
MGKFIVKRLLALIPTILIIVFVVYFIMDLTPSDPGHLILGQNASEEAIAAKNEELGWNDPFLVRYVRYIWDLCHGDLGTSWTTGKSVFQTVMQRFPVTITLSAGATLIGVVLGVLLGILSAVKQYSLFDMAGTTLAMALASFPAFWIGMMLIILFSLKLGWLPSYGADSFKHFILPWFTTACSFIASQLRMTRTSMLESIRMDYIRTARAKGQKESIVIYKHALRNALMPVVTIMGMNFGVLLGGTVTVETVFTLNGVGTLLLSAIRSKDIPVVVGAIVILATCYTLVMLVVDILYAFIDPQIKARYLKR